MLILHKILQKILKIHKSIFLNNTVKIIIKNNYFSEARKTISNLFNHDFIVDKSINNELLKYNIDYNKYLQTLIRSKLPSRFLFYQVLNNKFYKNKSIIYPIYFGIINNKKNLIFFIINCFNFVLWYFFCIYKFLNNNFFLRFKLYYKDKDKIKSILSQKQKIIVIQSDQSIFSEKLLNWVKENEDSYFPIFLDKNLTNNIFHENYAILKDNSCLYFCFLNSKFILKTYFLDLLSTLFHFIFLLNWKKLLTFDEFLELKLFRKIGNKNNLKYLFLYTINTHKPLWTFEANSKGIDTFLFFNGCTNEITTSMNNESHSLKDEDIYGSTKSHWKQFYIWNLYHQDYLDKTFLLKDKTFITKKYLVLGSLKRQPVKKNSLILFPHDFNNAFYGFEMLMQYYYSNKDLFYMFHENIKKIALNYDMNIVIKLKKINSWCDSNHINYIKNLCNNKNISLADTACDIEYLIKDSVGIISMPNTSAPVIANELGIKNAIYDPLNYVKRNDNCLFGLKLLTNFNQLDNFIKELK